MRYVIQAFSLATALLVTACGGEFGPEEGELAAEPHTEDQDAIMGGTTITTALGAVRVKARGGGVGSGVIIGPRTIITNAHVLAPAGYGTNPADVAIAYYDQSQWYCISNAEITPGHCDGAYGTGTAWVNPDFETASGTKAKAETDFAIFTLNRDLSYIASAHHQKIIEAPTKAMIGTFYSIGYGARSDTEGSGDPMQARFSVDTMGTKYFYSLGGRLDGVAGDTGMANCSGDSGSPQFEKFNGLKLVFGLHSRRSPGNGDCGELDTRQYGVIPGAYMSRIETHLGRACRHINLPPWGMIAQCWP